VKILFVSAEALPYYKTGGLADVARALPDALVATGNDVRIFLPAYRFLQDVASTSPIDAELMVPWPGGGAHARITLHEHAAGAAPAAFVHSHGFFDTARPYDPVPGDPGSLGRRFALFCRAAVAYANHWGADIVQLNDWQTGLVPAYALTDGLRAATVFAIHNLAYQGNFPPGLMREIGLSPVFLRTENGVEFHSQISFMKGGISLADRLVTVSPTYAREMQTPAYGNGLDGLMSFRRRLLHGVLNGIDTEAWNPATDELLPERYNARTLAKKDASRALLLERSGVAGDGPVLGIVSRLAHQKGIDTLLGAMPELLHLGCRIIVLGSGEPALEHAIASFAQAEPSRIAFRPGFDERLAHLIYAGADFFLMPSLYEPCGLGQMISQRYGTPPVARRTGGLNDTVEDGVTGFLFDDPPPRALAEAVWRATQVWQKRGWRALQRRCMTQDHSWTRSAADYEKIYALAVGAG
jgi:starch synthase